LDRHEHEHNRVLCAYAEAKKERDEFRHSFPV
jgi:hypothetical protein